MIVFSVGFGYKTAAILTEEEQQAMAHVNKHLRTSPLHFSAHEEHLEKFRKELKGSINMDIGDLEEDTK